MQLGDRMGLPDEAIVRGLELNMNAGISAMSATILGSWLDQFPLVKKCFNWELHVGI